MAVPVHRSTIRYAVHGRSSAARTYGTAKTTAETPALEAAGP